MWQHRVRKGCGRRVGLNGQSKIPPSVNNVGRADVLDENADACPQNWWSYCRVSGKPAVVLWPKY